MRKRQSSTAPFWTNPIATTATRWNPIEPAITGVHDEKNLANAIVAGFQRIFPAWMDGFSSIPSILGESADSTRQKPTNIKCLLVLL